MAGDPNNPTYGYTGGGGTAYDPTNDYKRQIAELQRRLASGQYDQGQFWEFQAKISSLQQLLDAYNKQNAPGDTNLGLPTEEELRKQFFDPEKIQTLFNTLSGNLSTARGASVSGAMNAAGAFAGQRGLANPGNFIVGAGTRASAPFAQAFGQLEAGRGSALLNNNQALLNALMNRFNLQEQARQFNVTDEQRKAEFRNQFLFQNQQFQNQLEQQIPGLFDYLTLAVQAAPAIAGAIKCWIAEALYGENDERTHLARYAVNLIWPRTKTGRFFGSLYLKYGKKVASLIRKYRILKYLFLPVFEIIWRQGRNELKVVYG